MDDRWFRGTLHELSPEECLVLLADKQVGRMAYSDEAGPVILPVNYAVENQSILFRTSAASSMAMHLRDRTVAFEVDDVDEVTESGWSVLVRGTATFVQPAGGADDHTLPTPWPQGSRNLLIRITPHLVTGRRLLAG
jgi:nitroimidazol reductase NimA-like FMN-containing flavoprotein (pyridoxamine 5'-phosphate oxidase superfamily)